MSGLAGILEFAGGRVEDETLRRMTSALAHRGPDGETSWAGGVVGMGFRRAARRDSPEAARQPMASLDRSLHLVFDGSLSNAAALRAELESLGHRFRGGGDAEVVLRGWEAWEEQVLPRLDGAFAFLLFDARTATLFAARDRFGARPLHYHAGPERLVIASEAEAIPASGLVAAELDEKAAVEHLACGTVLSDRTLFRGVRALPAGWSMLVRGAPGALTVHRWWDVDFAVERPSREWGEADCARALGASLADAVEANLAGDEAPVLLLSGGAHSSAIAAAAVRRRPDLVACTAILAGEDAARAAAEECAARLGLEQYLAAARPEDLGRTLAAGARHLQVPRVGSRWGGWALARLAAGFSSSVLCGIGARSLFGAVTRECPPAEHSLEPERFAERAWPRVNRAVPEAEFPAALGARMAVAAAAAPPRERLLEVARNAPHFALWSPSNQAAYVAIKTRLPASLAAADALAAAHGMSLRCPFLDRAVVDVALRMPGRYKDAGILARALGGPDPPPAAPSPAGRSSAALGAVAADILNDARCRERGLLRPEWTQEQLAAHASGRDRSRVLWALVGLELWCRASLDR